MAVRPLVTAGDGGRGRPRPAARPWAWLLPVLAGATMSCGPSPSTEQARLGAEIYEARCAVCHEQEDDPTIGTKLDRATLRSYRTAKSVFDYTSFAMPYDAPRSMTSERYWAVTAHMLRSRGLLDPDVVLGPDNADSVAWSLAGGPP